MLSILVHAQSVRWLFPAAAMLSAAPIHITVWTAVRLLTLPLPRRVYRALDDSLYSTYQRYVLFFMRCYTGAEVINFSRKGKNVLKNLINVLNDTVFLASLYFSGRFFCTTLQMINIVIPFITSACNVLVFVSIPRHIPVLNTRPDVYTYRFNFGGFCSLPFVF